MKAWRILLSENEVPAQLGLIAAEFPRRNIDIDPETDSLIYMTCQHGRNDMHMSRDHTYIIVALKIQVKLGNPKL